MPNVLTRSGSSYAAASGTTAANCTLTTDTNPDLLWKPTGIRIQWTSSATVGTRQVKLTITDANLATISSLIAVVTQAASLSALYSWYVGAPLTGTALSVGTARYSTWPLPDMILPAGSILTATDIANIDPDDVVNMNVLYNTIEPVPR